MKKGMGKVVPHPVVRKAALKHANPDQESKARGATLLEGKNGKRRTGEAEEGAWWKISAGKRRLKGFHRYHEL